MKILCADDSIVSRHLLDHTLSTHPLGGLQRYGGLDISVILGHGVIPKDTIKRWLDFCAISRPAISVIEWLRNIRNSSPNRKCQPRRYS